MPNVKSALPSHLNAALLLADGTIFWGQGFGAKTLALGEICFNTSMTGYQEVMTDPSYQGQIVTFTFPHIGNVGCNGEDVESGYELCASGAKPARNPQPTTRNPLGASGLIVREPVTAPSNFRSTQHFSGWLEARGVAGISGVDTRALTRHIRRNGAQNAAIVRAGGRGARGEVEKAQARLALHPSLEGLDLAKQVSTKKIYEWTEPLWSLNTGGTLPPVSLRETSPARSSHNAPPRRTHHVVAIDYGEKLNILRALASLGCRVTVVPAETSAREILALRPDGVFLSNGPGDPAATGIYAIPVIKALMESGIPLFGICLGHQLLGIAMGGKTEKMKQGHRGANHPVKDLKTGKVEITSQNHGFVVSEALPKDVEVTHRSLFDGTIQGLRHKTKPIFCVQGHPEASPGPHDSLYLFKRFVEMMERAQ